MMFLESMDVDGSDGTAVLPWAEPSTTADLIQLAHAITHHGDRFLER